MPSWSAAAVPGCIASTCETGRYLRWRLRPGQSEAVYGRCLRGIRCRRGRGGGNGTPPLTLVCAAF
jgi:hypothetical protein